jgi:translation initiation factor IF-2
MSVMTVSEFAAELKIPAPDLLKQLAKAGVSKQAPDDMVSEQDKTLLLEYLRKAHGEVKAKSKITLTRKQTTEIRASDSAGKSRTIQVEVRKKRVFVKRDAPEISQVSQPVTDDKIATATVTENIAPAEDVVLPLPAIVPPDKESESLPADNAAENHGASLGEEISSAASGWQLSQYPSSMNSR